MPDGAESGSPKPPKPDEHLVMMLVGAIINLSISELCSLWLHHVVKTARHDATVGLHPLDEHCSVET